MALTIRQAILEALQEKPLTQAELLEKVRKLRWKLNLWENLKLSKKFPEELRRLRQLKRVNYLRVVSRSGSYQFKYVLLGKEANSWRKKRRRKRRV